VTMRKEDIVKRVFEEGMMISPKTVEKISESNLEETIRKAKAAGARVVDDSFLSVPAEPAAKKPSPEKTAPEQPPPENPVPVGMTVVIEEHRPKEKMTPKDFSSFYGEKYEGIRDLLVGKVRAVSVSNAKNASDVTVIGMVKEMHPQGFVLEDPTGEVTVVSQEPGIAEDDVVGVSGITREGRITNTKVIYPDVPLSRKIGSLKAAVVLSRKNRTAAATDTLLTCESPAGGAVSFPGSPSRATMGGKIVILKTDAEKADPEEATAWLRKRHLPHGRKVDSDRDDLLIKQIPDILWINSDSEKWSKIYKGIIIVATPKDGAVRINLENKEIEFL
jgi:hypothetical protein